MGRRNGNKKKGKQCRPKPIPSQEKSLLPAKLSRRQRKKLKQAASKEEEDKWKNDVEAFQAQLLHFGLHIKVVKGDGNCLFRSICDQMKGAEHDHQEFRQQIV